MAAPVKGLSPLTLREGWSRTPSGPHGAVYKIRFDWPSAAPLTATLVIDDMTQALRVKLNGKAIGLRFTYPFRFDLSAALRRGPNELELEHTERYRFSSKLGSVRIMAYAVLEI